jgi:hypothetical protein
MFTTLVAALLAAPVAHAQEAAPSPEAAPVSEPAASPPPTAAPAAAVAKPAPSLPWLMRPTAAGNVVRSDTVFGAFDGGSAVTTGLLASYKLRPDLAVGGRLVFNVLSLDETDSATALANPAIFALWSPKLDLPVGLAFYGALVAPLGQGAGAEADPATVKAVAAGVQTRQGMDNALFATNYATVVVGVGAGWVRGPLTLAAEATVLQLFRVRDVAGLDDNRTNFTTGFHAGYGVWGPLTASAELHLQRWLVSEQFLDDPAKEALHEQATWTVGLRGLWKVGDYKLRPGLSYSRAFDDPMNATSYQIVQVDIPVVF